MKNLYFLLFLCNFLIPSFAEAQAPEGINYQAMYRNASGTAQPYKKISVRININQGASNGSLVYTERHKTKTNGQGLFNIIVGNGLSPDDFSSIDWSFGPYFMHIEIDDIDLSQNIYFGFQQLLSVPYALHAKVADSVAGGSSGSGEDGLSAYEIWLDQGNSGTEIDFLTSLEGEDGQDGQDGEDGQDGADGQGGVTSAGTNVTITGSGVQADPYVVNASDDQNLTGANLNGTELQIDIENGNSATVDLAALQDGIGTDNQDLDGAVLDGTILDLSIEDGNGVSVNLAPLQDGVDDADNDPTNELNTGATFNNNILEIQDAGGAVIADLSALDNSGTDDQDLAGAVLNGTTLDLSIEDGNGVSVDLAPLQDGVDDADNDPTNELQDISTNGAPGNISISDGSTINLNIDDADFDPFNEITTVVDNGNGTSTITDVLGGSVIVDNDGIDNVDDADNDPTNEWNTGATFNNNILEIQDAGGAVIADLSILDNSGTDDQNISGSSLTGTILKIGIENGASETIDLSSLQDGVDDADNDPTNEWNTGVALNGSELEITDLGGTLSVDLEDLKDNDWYKQPVGSNEQTSSISDEIYTNSNVLINGFGATGPFGSSLTAPNDFNALTIRNGDINSGWKSVSIDLRGINTDAKIIAGNESANLGTNGYFAIQTRKNEILSERFRINSGGNVGINISDPSQLTNKLQVDGSVRFDNLVSSAGTENNGLLLNGLNQVVSRSFDVVAFNGEIDGDITNELQELTISNGTVGITQGNSIELPWQRNDASGEIYPNVLTDKVGIGTNNPEYDLDVQGILASTYLLPNLIDANSNRLLRIGVPGNYPGGIQWNGSNNTSGESGDLSFLTYNNTDLTLAPNGTGVVKVFNHDLIINSGRVGVNTTSPGTALDVVGVLELSNVAPTDPGADIVRLGDGGSNLQIQTNYGYTKIGPQNTGWSHFYTDRSRYFFDKGLTVDGGLIGSYNEDLSIQTSGTTRMTIANNNGYVGIGIENPDSKLDVDGRIHSVHDESGQAALWLEHNGTAINGNYGIYQTGSGSNNTINYLEGNLGIGSIPSTSGEKLQIQGDISVTGKYKDSDGLTGANGQVLTSSGTGTKWMDNKNTEFTQSTVNRNFNEIGGNSSWYDVSELGGQLIQCKAGDRILVMAWARWDHNAASQVQFRVRRGPSSSAVTVGEEMTIEENDTGSSWDDEITTNFQWVDTIPSNGSYYYNFEVRAVESWGTIYSSNVVLINLGQ